METSAISGVPLSHKIISIDFNQFEAYKDDVFQDSLSQFIDAETEKENSIAISYINKLYSEALIQLRKNRINAYMNSKSKIEAVIKSLSLNENELKVIAISEIPVRAYYFYKKKDYTTSIMHTEKAIVNDDHFLDKYYSLYGHKIQQLHNIIRTLFRSGKTKEACLMNDNVLSHLIAGRSINYRVGKWEKSFDIMKTLDLAVMIYQILTETIFTINNIIQTKEEESKLFALAFGTISKVKFPKVIGLNVLQKWLLLKISFSYKREYNENSIIEWKQEILTSKFAMMSKPLFYSLYLDLGNGNFIENREQFIKEHYS